MSTGVLFIQCQYCGKETPNRTHPVQKRFCSRKCKGAYRVRHSEAWMAYHKAHRAESDARWTAWRTAHPDVAKADRDRRQAIKRGVDGPPITVTELLERGGEWCGLCGASLRDDITIDHLKPLSRGGTHEKHNLLLAHFNCNRSKHDKPFVEWALALTA